MDLTSKVAIVTGSTKGIGRAIAEEFGRGGAKVVVNGRDEAAGAEVVQGITTAGGTATFVRADLGIEAEVGALVEAATAAYGGVDVLVNNAAPIDFMGAGGDAAVADQTTERFDRFMKVGLYGPFWACRFAIPSMRERGGGSIINISSISSMRGQPGVSSYMISKAGLNALTLSIAADYAAAGIRCNAIVIGFVVSGELAKLVAQSSELMAALQGLDLIKTGEPADIAHLARFLAADDSRFLTGGLLPADGGLGSRSQMPDFSALLGSLAEN